MLHPVVPYPAAPQLQAGHPLGSGPMTPTPRSDRRDQGRLASWKVAPLLSVDANEAIPSLTSASA
eukprot:scaffold7446_cov403-Prasinococcus_capsulatus_cf.AAC.16